MLFRSRRDQSSRLEGDVRPLDLVQAFSLKQELASLRMLEPGQEGEHRLLSVMIGPDGNSLAAVSNDGHLKIWRAKSMEALRARRAAQVPPAGGLRVF